MKDNSQPAFPMPVSHTAVGDYLDGPYYGMTLRQWYAGMAMQGMLASWPDNAIWKPLTTAKTAFEFADAMLSHEAKEEE